MKSLKYYLNTYVLLCVFLFPFGIKAQDNCNVFKMQGDSCRYKACDYLQNAPGYFQLTREYHEIKDSALAICPEYGIVYKNKSTAYLKTGDFITWKKLIDKAVELNPQAHLDYRAWCRFQFFRDYEGALKDFEELERIKDYDIGYCQNGHYHLKIAQALCYKMIGQKEKALGIITDQLAYDESSAGLYTYLHLGVLYMETDQLDKALEAFDKQSTINKLAENEYYKALIYRKQNLIDEYNEALRLSKELYESYRYMFDPYGHHVDKIYLSDIEKLLSE